MLIVLADADNLTTVGREQTLHGELNAAGHSAVMSTEPIVVLVPKWQVETWIKCTLGQPMSENDRHTDQPPVSSDEVRDAAKVVFDWARPGAQVGATCVPSLAGALPR
jgi:hypothetical protein